MAKKKATKKKSVQNPYCPVPGCRAKAPHASDSLVSTLITIMGDPRRLTMLARTGMTQLLISMERDWADKRQFSWFCRMRQPEELYYKTLYAVFFASEKELHHMLSGDLPNSLIPYYTKVNEELYGGKWKLTDALPGLPTGSALNTTMEVLHSGAHTAFSALLTGYAFATNANLHPYAEKLHLKILRNVERFDWIHRLFMKGHTKQEVLHKFKNDANWRDELEQLKAESTQGGGSKS